MTHRLFHGALDRGAFTEPDFELGGMDVDVHVPRYEEDVQEERRAVTRMNGRAIARLGGAKEEIVLEGASVDEQLGAPPGGLRIARPLDEPFDSDRPDPVAHRDHRPRQVPTPDGSQPFFERLSRREVKAAPLVGEELEADLRMGECQHRDRIAAHPRLARDRSEEFPAGGRVEEEGAHRDGGPLLAGRGRDLVDPTTGHRHFGPLPVRFGRDQRQA